jgi:hypothetical protein
MTVENVRYVKNILNFSSLFWQGRIFKIYHRGTKYKKTNDEKSLNSLI